MAILIARLDKTKLPILNEGEYRLNAKYEEVEGGPSFRNADISSFIDHHSGMSAVDFVMHFLEKAAPTKENFSLSTGRIKCVRIGFRQNVRNSR
jgi:hypothetical protein